MSREVRCAIMAAIAGLAVAACSLSPASSPANAPDGSATPSAASGAPDRGGPVTTGPIPTAPGGERSSTSATGITGITVVDPCPMTRYPPCEGTPVAARLSISDATTGALVASVTSDASGRFRVDLRPGSYLIQPVGLVGGPSRPAGAIAATVAPGQYTTVTVRFDRGIR